MSGPRASEESAAVKAAADAATAKVDADRKQREFDEWNSESSRGRRAVENDAAVAKAVQEAASSSASRWAGFVPDLTGVDRGATTYSGDQAMFGSSLALMALGEAAEKVAAEVRRKAPTTKCVLVTSEVDLATADAAYHAVVSGLEELLESAAGLLPPDEADGWEEGMGEAVVGAVAKAIPSVLSLLAPHRAVSGYSAVGDDLSAATCVLGALLAENVAKVAHDDFRTLAPGAIETDLATLKARRHAVKALAASGGADVPVEAIKAFVADVDTFLAFVSAVPEGAVRSQLTNAILKQGLHTGEFEHVLLVKALTGSSTQVIEDRPLLFKDRFSVVATSNISFLLLDTATNAVVAAGGVSGTAAVHGKIGAELRLDAAVSLSGGRR
jgi:hypothetical protein